MIFNRLTSTILKVFIFSFLTHTYISPALAIDSSNIGSIFSTIWKNNTNAITGLNNLFSPSKYPSLDQIKPIDIEEIVKANTQSKQVLKDIAGKPIFKFLDEDIKSLNPTEKLKQSTEATSNLYSSLQNLKSRSAMLTKKWPELSESDIKSELTILASIFTQDLKEKDTNIISTTNWLKSSWDSPLLVNISDEAQATQSQIEILLNDTISFGKVNSPSVLLPILTHITKFEELVGTSLAKSTDQNLYGYLKKINDQINLYDLQTKEGIRILTELRQEPDKYQTDAINNLNGLILGINHIPGAGTFFSPSIGLGVNENKVLDLLALADTNKILLGSKTGEAIKNAWLDNTNDNKNFRIVVSNPNRTQIQKANIRFALPPEIRIEQVISNSPELNIGFDPTVAGLVATGELSLLPLETKTLNVVVENIWIIDSNEIGSLKAQVNDLVNFLSNTDSAVKANTFKNEIDVSLDKIIKDQEQAITPDASINSFRGSSVELSIIEEKIISLMNLTLQSKTTGNVLGVSSTFQSIPFKGLAIFVILSLGFWAIYLNALKSEPKTSRALLQENDDRFEPLRKKKYLYRENSNSKISRMTKMVIITLISGGLGAFAVSLVLRISKNTPIAHKTDTTITTQVLGEAVDSAPKKFPYETQTMPPKSGGIPVHILPSLSSPQITSLKDPQKISVFKKVGHWVLVAELKDKSKLDGWWIQDSFLQ